VTVGSWGLGFGVWVLGVGGWGVGVWGLYFGVLGFDHVAHKLVTSAAEDPRPVWGLGFVVWGLGFRVWGLGFVVWGLEVECTCFWQRSSMFCLGGSCDV